MCAGGGGMEKIAKEKKYSKKILDRQGIEPWTSRMRIARSTTELPALIQQPEVVVFIYKLHAGALMLCTKERVKKRKKR